MGIAKKKVIRIFANGSLISSEIIYKKSDVISVYEKDHTTFMSQKSNVTDFKKFNNYFKKHLKFFR